MKKLEVKAQKLETEIQKLKQKLDEHRPAKLAAEAHKVQTGNAASFDKA